MKEVEFAILDEAFAKIKGITLIQRMILCLTSYFPDGMEYNNEALGEFFQIGADRVCHLIKELLDLEFLVILKRQSRHREIYLNKEHPTLVKIAKYHKELLRCKSQSRNCLHCYLQRSTLVKIPNSIKRIKETDTKEGKKPVVDNLSLSIISTKPKAENNAKSRAISPAEFMDYWNTHETLPEIHTFTDQRKRALATRCKEPVFVENWKQAIDRLSHSPFHTGQNDRKWRADVDWLLKNDTNYVRILELTEPEFGSRAVTEEEAEELMKEVRKYENE